MSILMPMSYKKKAVLVMLPSLAGFMLFYTLPFFYSFRYAMTRSVFDASFVGLGNFGRVLANDTYMLALGNTVRFTILGVALIMLFSLFVSFLFSQAGPKYSPLRAAFIIPMLLPTAGLSLIWRVIFNPDGALSFSANISSGFWGELVSPQLVPLYLMFLWKYCGFNIILITSAMAGIQTELYDAARLDGAGLFNIYRRIIIPQIRPVLFFCLILSTVNSFRVFREIYFLFGGDYPPNSVYMIQHFMNNQFGRLNYQLLSAGAIMFTAIIVALLSGGMLLWRGRSGLRRFAGGGRRE